MNVAVVGAGIAGASAARNLSKRGHQVTLFDQFPFGHSLGSSHGASRIVRRAYPDPFYTECMLEAYPLWAELEDDSGEKLVNEVGLLYFGPQDRGAIPEVVAALEALRVPHRVVDSHDVGKVFSSLRLGPGEIGVWTPEAGWVRADRAVQASISLAARAGTHLRPQTLVSRDFVERAYDAFVVCTGPWINDWVDVPVAVTLQTYAFIDAKLKGPVWIEDNEHMPYGFPSESKRGVKVGVHKMSQGCDLGSNARTPSEEALAEISATVSRRFGIESPSVLEAAGCLYTSTFNEDFILGRLGDKGFFASACSGHGFKFGPWIGKLMADFVEGKGKPEDWPRFNQA